MKTTLYCLFLFSLLSCGSEGSVAPEVPENTEIDKAKLEADAQLDFVKCKAEYGMFVLYINQGLRYYEMGSPDSETEKKAFDSQDKANELLNDFNKKYSETSYKDSATIYLDSVSYYRGLLDTAHEEAMKELGM